MDNKFFNFVETYWDQIKKFLEDFAAFVQKILDSAKEGE